MKQKRRMTGAAVFFLVFLCGSLVYSAEQVSAANLSGNMESEYQGNQVILSWTGEPAHSQTISWTTEDGRPGYVKWTEKSGQFTEDKRVKAVITPVKEGKYYRYEAVIGGLSQSTEYRYMIGNGLQWSKPREFRTAPDKLDSWMEKNSKQKVQEESVTFLYLGDAQFASSRKKGKQWSRMLQIAEQKNPDAAFGLIGGDLINSGEKLTEWELFFEMAEPLFSRIPLMSAMGNHETRKAKKRYSQLMALPENGPDNDSGERTTAEEMTEEFYSFDYGNCHIVSLNSSVFLENTKEAEQKLQGIHRWLQEDLNSAGVRWKIVMLHHPPYGVASEGGIYEELRKTWCSVFSAAGVDLVLCGHQHLYLRTEEIGGVTYIMGNSGPRRSQYFKGDNVPDYVKRLDVDSSNYQVVTASQKELRVASFNQEGRIIDQWTKKDTGTSRKGRSAGVLIAVTISILIIVRIFWWPTNSEPKYPC